MLNYIAETPQLEISDAELELNITALNEQVATFQEEIKLIVPGRDASRENYMFHLSEGSNAYAMGDQKTWLFHKKLRDVLQQAHFGPLLTAKDKLAKVIDELNPLEDEILRREGKFYVHEGKTLGNATKTTSYPVQSPEWHTERANGIGGSDIASILGISPWLERDELFLFKTGQKTVTTGSKGTGHLWRGTVWEDAIARTYLSNHIEDSVFVNCKTSWRSSKNDYQTANIDGLLYPIGGEKPKGIVEIKTSSVPESWKDGVPDYYRLQALWYLDTFGFEYADFAVLIDDYDYQEFHVVPEVGEMDRIHEEVQKFMDEVNAYKANH